MSRFFERPRGRWLARHFGPRIIIRITASEVEVQHKARHLTLEPCVWLRGGVVTSVGGVDSDDGSTRVELFGADGQYEAREIARSFFSFALRSVLERSLTVRPVVTLLASIDRDSLRHVICALEEAGAAEVIVAGT
jgi:hypothetical protein